MIVISEFMDEAVVADMKQRFEVNYDPTLVDDPARLIKQVSAAKALIVRNRTQVTADLLDHAPALRCIGRLGVGLDNIDMESCQAREISVYPASGANDLSVAEYVVTTAMMLLRGAYLSAAAMRAGEWPRQACAGREIAGKTLGLVGYGAIARHTASLARPLGMHIQAYDPFVQPNDEIWGETSPCTLEELLATSDVVSLHTPLTAQTRHLINADRLAGMKAGAVLINAARGGVVDEAALAAALRNGPIGAAALDVFEDEPLSATGAAKFDGLSNILLTPHIAGVTEESNVRVSQLISDLVSRHLTELD